MNIVDKIIAKEKQNKLLRSKGIIVLDDFKFDKTKKEKQETLNKFYKGGRMNITSWKKSIYYLSDKEIVQYYGQIWINVKHLKLYIKELRQRYILEVKE